jgi:hypothetical protein
LKVGDVAACLGKGPFARVVGTAAMTVSSTAEVKIRDRQASAVPANAAGKILGVEPKDEAGEARFSNLVRWGYGTGWGAVRGLFGAAGLEGTTATVAHFGAVWGSEQVMLPALGVAPPFWTWGAKEVGIDAFHNLVYAGATGAAYALLDR